MGRPSLPVNSATELLQQRQNLPRVVGKLLKAGSDEWIYHLRLALEDLESISWHQREDDRAEYLMLHYRDGLTIPSLAGKLRDFAHACPDSARVSTGGRAKALSV